MIEFRNVSKTYSTGTEAVHNATFTIDKGEFAFLVGSSGSGKSTLIKLILKEEDATSGNIIVNGKDITFLRSGRIPALRRSMGVVFQDFRLLPDKTVFQNVAFAMQIVRANRKYIQRHVPMVLELVGLKDKGNCFPHELSGGEQQRVAIARALVNNPSMIIADEPTGNLDPDTAWGIMGLLKDINLRGTTIVMATHARDIVDRMKKRVIFISIITMIFTMFVFGGFFAIGQNVNSFLVQVQEKEGIEVFIYDETTEQQKNEFETSVKALDGVNSVTFKSKNAALEDFKSRIAKESDNASEILEGYSGDNNIFPASFIVRLTDLEKATAVEEEIARIGARIATENRTEVAADFQTENSTQKDTIVKRILSKNQVIDVMVKLVRGARIAIGIIFIILLIFSVTIISNTIKLSLHARRREMSIMKYVGATNSFVRGPYVIEGMILGLISSVISLLLIGSMYDAIIKQIESSNVLKQIGISLLTFLDIANGLIIVYLFLGIGIGIIGSAVSMKKYLEV